MLRKILILNLLFALALLPAAQAMSPVAAPADSDRHAHELMVMDCGQVDPGHCIDFESCASGSHASCDAQTKSSQISQLPVDQPRSQLYASHSAERYLSHHAELLLRPPRNA